MRPSLAVLYEHPSWFEPLWAVLDQRSVAYDRIHLPDHSFDPASSDAPAGVILSRVAMSSFLRDPEHGIFYASALLDHWQRLGSTVLNGAATLAVDSSKARQLSLIAALGLDIPATRIVHRAEDLPAAASGLRWPLLVKANIGGSGAGISLYSSPEALAQAVRDRSVPQSIDKVLLLQEYVPPRGGTIMRIETLGGRFLYAIQVESSGESFDLCPADACVAAPGRKAIRMEAVTPSPALIQAAERIAAAASLDVGGVELVIDERDGKARFYDINALSNFVAEPLQVLGWDPHDRFADWIEAAIASRQAAKAKA